MALENNIHNCHGQELNRGKAGLSALVKTIGNKKKYALRIEPRQGRVKRAQ